MIDGGPLHGGASAELIINDEFQLRHHIENSLKSVVGVASFTSMGSGQVKFQLVDTTHRLFSKLLKECNGLNCTLLPVFIVWRKNNPAADATPEPVG